MQKPSFRRRRLVLTDTLLSMQHACVQIGTGSTRQAALLILAIAAASTGASAQDSYSRNANGGSGLPGDASSPFLSTAQRLNYVVDLTSFATASGTTLGIGPVMKSGRFGSARFTAINGASSISQTARANVAYPAASYTAWVAGPGGMNNFENDTSLNQTVTPTGTATVFGAGFMDFDEALVTTTNVFTNQLYGGLIAYDPATPDRLFVSRINAALNATNGQLDRSQFGYGGVDSDGNLYFRADSFGSAGPTSSLLVGDNYFRVRLAARTTALNSFDNAGGSHAASTDWLLQRSIVTHTTPTCLDQALAGRPLLAGADFVGNYKFEGTVGTLTSTGLHRPLTTDQRGAAHISGVPVFSGSVATASVLTRSTGGGGKTDSLSLSGLAADGSVTSARTLTLPATLTDACDSFQWPIGAGDFRNYDSQVTFRGGGGPVATTKDHAGRAIAAAVVYNGSITSPANPFNAIAAVRFNPSVVNSPASWTTIAWVNSVAQTGKELTGDFGADGVPATFDGGEGDGNLTNDAPIGRLASLAELNSGPVGPSLSAPTFDAAGNAYFVASVALKKRSGPVNQFDYKLALIRAVYNPADFCYRLDVVAEAGQVFRGRNSGKNYQLAALNLSDSDSVSTAALWSSSGMQQAWNNSNTAALSPSAPQHLGGLVLSSRIVYDVNNDGLFRDPTAIGGDAASTDEGYNVVLYIGNVTAESAPPCFADYDGSGGVDGSDVEAFFLDWSSGLNAADTNLDGGVDGQDVETFFLQWSVGGC